MPPLVSILMTGYNRQAYIAEAIESVLGISYSNWELIIVDDCSRDNTFRISKGYAKLDSRIRVYKNEKNLGDYGNRNRAASYAKGVFIVIVDSDDLMIRDVLEKWVAVMLDKNASFGIHADSENHFPVLFKPEVIITKHFFDKPLLTFGPIATIIKRSYFDNINGFPEKYGPANDRYYNLKAASQTDTIVFPYPLVNYRIHEGQEFNNKYSYLYNNYRYLRDALMELDLHLSMKEKEYLLKKNKRRFFTNIVTFYLKTKDLKKTTNAIKLAEFTFKDAFTAVFQKK
jgi:glycosyltransferase involved in cell wall biosynthesis